ncbi:DUF2225 domain-containing protein [Rossellomorea vietnamensis]|uniref:DUF2225 domain-containing protein n=1 Tax=Rossellomorea vietnamensis TaxID=218284 RepID=A0A0P6W1A8_9BACI|nr:DUF2225 domain-containing protein [Rossellomorea vietnamensis]KPL59006.1 hypothetical protein AM506_13775 [Rossellomorea vietnamensis]
MTVVTPFYDKKNQCLSCKHSYSTTRIRSRFVKLAGYDSDFCPLYQSDEVNPLLYNVSVCPQCGFSYTDDFTAYIPPVLKSELEKKISLHWQPQDYGKIRSYEDAVNTYKLAAYCALIKKEKKVTTAGLYLRTAWLYRKIDDKEQERRFINLAAHEYIDAYVTDGASGSMMSETKLLYIIAELLRRQDKIEEAAAYLSKVISKQHLSNEPKIIEMARERWYEIREMHKEMKTM